jgi:hypothetical protein
MPNEKQHINITIPPSPKNYPNITDISKYYKVKDSVISNIEKQFPGSVTNNISFRPSLSTKKQFAVFPIKFSTAIPIVASINPVVFASSPIFINNVGA